jgi:hypothetical protein
VFLIFSSRILATDLLQNLWQSHWITQSKYHCTAAHIKTSLYCRTFNSQLNSLDSSIICRLPTPELSIHFSAETAIYSQLSSQISTLDSQFLIGSVNVNILPGPNRKHGFQQYPYCVLTDPLLRNGLFCCMNVHFCGNLFTEPLPSKELFRISGVISHYGLLSVPSGPARLNHLILRLWNGNWTDLKQNLVVGQYELKKIN